MKKTLCSILTLLTFVILVFSPDSFAQTDPAEHVVQVIYFLPNDRAPHPDIDTKLHTLIKDIQKFYADEMERNGFSRKTFRLETNVDGKTLIHHVNGQFAATYYNAEPGAFGKIRDEVDEWFGMPWYTAQNIYLIAADVTYPGSHWRGGGAAVYGGPAIVFIPFDDGFITRYHTGHEIGHSFGLPHDFRYASESGSDIMSYWVGIDFEDGILSKCAAEWLDVHPYFNMNQTSPNEPATIQMLQPLAYPPNAISLRFEITDPDGLYQAQLEIPREYGFSLHACRSLSGEASTTIEFITTELTETSNNVQLRIIDVHGNFGIESYDVPWNDIRPVNGPIHVDYLAPQTLQLLSGDEQSGYLNNRLTEPFVVLVRDVDSAPVAGVQVTFQVIAGDGTLSVTNPWTDSDGRAQSFLTLGSFQGEHRVLATVSGVLNQVTFRAKPLNTTIVPINPWKTLVGHTETVFSLAFSPDGSTLASGGWDQTVRLWDVATATLRNTLTEHTRGDNSVAFSPDGSTLANGSGRTVWLRDVATGNLKNPLIGHTGTVRSVAFSPDGSTLASGSYDTTVRLWDVATGTTRNILKEHTDIVLSVAFSPDGRTLASASASGDRTLRLWDAATGRHINMLTGHTGGVLSLAFSPDGRTLAGAVDAPDQAVLLWDVATGNLTNTLIGHTRAVSSVAFSPDGRTLVSASADSTVRLWDVATGTTRNILIGHTREVDSVAFSPDSITLASGSFDGMVLLWRLTPANAMITFTPSEIPNQTFTAGSPITPLVLPEATGGTAPYTYTLSSIPNGLAFDTTTRELSGTPTTAETTATTYTATDAANVSASLTFTITVRDKPTFDPSVIADQVFTVGEVVNLTLPVATGGTPPYTYTLAPLPEGLSFDRTTRELSGTPTTAETTTATYTATDAADVSASLTFTIEVTEGVILDVNGDGQVTVIDLAMVALFYGTQVPADTRLPADVNADGIVNILDLTAVAQGIDDASDDNGISLQAIEAALLAAAEQAADIAVTAEAPTRLVRFQNIADALADVRHLATGDVRLGKRMAVLEELLHLLIEMSTIPERTALLPNYPNPFNPETWIPYHLAEAASVTLSIYNIEGQLVRTLDLGHQPAGVYQTRSRAAYWDGRNQIGEPVASGVYFYTLMAGDFSATRRMLILK